ncbi:MAG: hypothetical protein VXX87_03615 [Pseudomonadota bacterium]|nr:hypothetical protein [Pseudomonadota bacterium]
MLTLVSKPDTPVLPLALGPVLTGGMAGQGDDALRAFLAQEGYGAVRVLPTESGQRPRLIPAINAALWAQTLARDAVVLLLDGARCAVPTLAWRRSVRSAVALARTGRNTEVVSLGRDCPGADHAIPGVENAFSEPRRLPMALRQRSAAPQVGRCPGGVWAFRADAFLTEVEILCGGLHQQCQDIFETGVHHSPVPALQVQAQAGLGLVEGFWDKTDNCGAVVMDALWRNEAEPSITLQAAAADSAQLKRRVQTL